MNGYYYYRDIQPMHGSSLKTKRGSYILSTVFMGPLFFQIKIFAPSFFFTDGISKSILFNCKHIYILRF